MMICRIIVEVSLDTAPRSTVPSLKGLAEMATRDCIKLHIPEPLACPDLRGKTPAIPRLPGGFVGRELCPSSKFLSQRAGKMKGGSGSFYLAASAVDIGRGRIT